MPAAPLQDAEAELRWTALQDDELDAEIDALRGSIQQTSERLLTLGVTPDWEGDQAQPASRQGVDGEGAQGDDSDVRCADMLQFWPCISSRPR